MQSGNDVFLGGVVRSLAEIDYALSPVGTFIERGGSPVIENERHRVFGVNILPRLSATMRTSDMANGVFGQRVNTHSLRTGWATSLYTHGAPFDVGQRMGKVEVVNLPIFTE